MKNIIFVFLLIFAAFVSGAQAQKDLNNSSPVVVELFTSQGCPACPPADEYLGKLARSKSTIALACHVDYFNVRGDTLAKSFCTDRQTKYIEQIKRKSHFTPQMMVNGHMSAIGYDMQDVAAKMIKGKSEKLSLISIKPQNSGVFNFSIPERDFYEQADILLISYKRPLKITKRGRSSTYYQVIDKIMPLGSWGGSQISRAVYPLLSSTHAGFTIIAQNRRDGKIVAAGNYRMK
ncbi:MAG: DUF1223 domain-containing protein [Alphaproteobacteria bacterium]|nr:DUF1223 domain-containing protein [Alphaproteobacteria bacterium]